ncbi:MAG: S41 family peptidase [Patescibacteria group bacterium]
MTEQKNQLGMNMRKQTLTNVLLAVALIALIFSIGYKYGEYRAGKKISPTTAERFTNVDDSESAQLEKVDFGLFWETWNKVEKKFITREKLDKEAMFYGAIKGMVASLEDPYTFFLTPKENEQSKEDLGGRFEGIGAQLGLEENAIVIVAPLKNSPAEQAGVKAGDVIVEVDGKSTEGWTLNEAVKNIRGEQGTTVNLGLVRGTEKLNVDIVRDTIKVDSVELSYEAAPEGDVAYLKLNQFGDTTNTEWNDAINEIKQKYEQGEIEGMIVDVRGNPGGYLDSSVYIASEFLETDQVIVKQESTIEADKEYVVRRQGKLLEIPLVVMIDEGSASASEILAGALRDHDRATLVGKKSFGKGSVQEALDLTGGAGLHVTVAKWILPDGDWINGTGITPSIEVENEIAEGNTLTRETDAQLDAAIEQVLKQ